MRIFLTGPSGFLGSALVRHWQSAGHELWLLTRRASQLNRLDNVLIPTSRVVRLSDPEQVTAFISEVLPDAIVHTACSYGRRGESPLDVMNANLYLGIMLLQAVLDNPVQERGPISFLNTGTVLEPDVSLYALSKTQFSAWGAILATQAPQRLRFIDICLQQMYGPGDDSSKFTTHVIDSCLQNKPRLALTFGEQLRDFIHVDDVVSAYDHILKHHRDFAISDRIDVGSGIAITMRSFVENVKLITGSTIKLDFGAVPYRTREAMKCVADTARLRSLGWVPSVSLNTGLAQMAGNLG